MHLLLSVYFLIEKLKSDKKIKVVNEQGKESLLCLGGDTFITAGNIVIIEQ